MPTSCTKLLTTAVHHLAPIQALEYTADTQREPDMPSELPPPSRLTGFTSGRKPRYSYKLKVKPV